MQDFLPAFCENCEVNIAAMVDQHGDIYLVCACPDGRYELDGEAGEWIDARTGGDADV